jgi:hypothetical protein
MDHGQAGKEFIVKRFIALVTASTVLTAGTLFQGGGHVALATTKPSMSVTIVSVSPTTITTKKATVTFHLRVSRFVLDAVHMGKSNVAGRGHFQIYVDKIPTDAWVKKDLQHNWLAALAATTISLNLPPALVGGTGKHRIYVALAQNNYILYKVPTASITITVNK